MTILHLHLLLNHIPVVGTLFALLLFAAALLLRETVSAKFALAVTAGLAVVAIAVYFTGAPAEDAVEKLAGVTERAIERHEEAAEVATVAVGILGALSLLALLAYRAKQVPRWVVLLGFVGSIVTSALMGWTANLGGQIRHTEIQASSIQQTVDESKKGGDD